MPRKEQCVEECIHGLEVGLCDICYPKAAPDPVRAARQTAGRQSAGRQPAARQSRTTSASAGSAQPTRGGVATGSARSTHATTSKRSIVASQQRIYHVTHVRNLEAILDSRELRADATPVVDVSTALTRELRATVELPGATASATSSVAAGATSAVTQTVASRVAFYLSPDAALWNDLRSGAADEVRWSTAARSAAASDFVILVSTIGAVGGQVGGAVGGAVGSQVGGALGGAAGGAVGNQVAGQVSDVVVTDGDAAGTYTRFFTGEGVQRAVERAHDSETIGVGAEVLAGGVVDFASIQLIGVANDPARDRVRELVTAAGFSTKVAVYPPWFQPG